MKDFALFIYFFKSFTAISSGIITNKVRKGKSAYIILTEKLLVHTLSQVPKHIQVHRGDFSF